MGALETHDLNNEHVRMIMEMLSYFRHYYVLPVLLNCFNSCGSLFINTGGSDYNFTTQSFTMRPGERRCTSIEILDDVIMEQTREYIRVRLSTSISSSISSTYSYANIYIQDNDGE